MTKEMKPLSKPLISAEEICSTATSLVGNARAKTHGDKLHNHTNISALWTAFLRRRGLIADTSILDPHDVAIMMILLKVARTLSGSHNIDDYVDAAGYAGVAGEIAEKLFTSKS